MDDFLDKCCVVGADQQAKASSLYRRYRQWSESIGQSPATQKVFGSSLRERGFARKRRKDGYHWLGLGLRDDSDEPLDEPLRQRIPDAERADLALAWLEWLEQALVSDTNFARCVAHVLNRLAGKPLSANDVVNSVRILKDGIEVSPSSGDTKK
jgi:hypothetical protein